MTTLAIPNNNLTVADWVKRLDPDGKPAQIANILSQTNQILEDMVMVESNEPLSHRVTIVTGLPTVYWRSLGMGIPSSKAITQQVQEQLGLLEAFSQIDKKICELNGGTAAFRLSEEKPFMEAMNQGQAQALFYGSYLNDVRQYTGFRTRYNNTAAGNAQNVMDAGGTGTTNTSIWLVVWSDETVFCPFPKGTQAGLIHEDLGEEMAIDANGNQFRALKSRYEWANGLVVKDWRYVVRIANINVTAGTSPPVVADLLSLMSRALDRVPDLNAGRAAFYMNRTIFSMLRLQALGKSNAALAIEDALSQFGKPQKWTTFMGVPLRKVDQILNTESWVTTTT